MDEINKCGKWGKNMCHNGSTSMGYVLGFIGAAVYYVSMATSFSVGAIGVLKALVWPAFLVHGLLKFLGV